VPPRQQLQLLQLLPQRRLLQPQQLWRQQLQQLQLVLLCQQLQLRCLLQP
jgi:hypothetical protein